MVRLVVSDRRELVRAGGSIVGISKPMSYRALARAYRSNTFGDVVGQDPIATTLANAIRSGRVHHGYLFTGTRGVGKTSMARILAKALNCLAADAPTVTPCCRCASCTAIAVGEDIDVVEIDAASNRGIDNIRELRGNVILRPARSRFKVYIVDEVHMLTTEAFNALLKTLEEPPSHVKFILATTEAHKVPATVVSRCQRFDFHAIGADDIAGHLAAILGAENVKAENGVLRRIGRLANGSMRDALSLLDMVLSYEGEHLTTKLLEEIIPPPHDEMASAVIDSVARSDAAAALRALDAALQSGRTVERFCDHLIEHVRTLMLLRLCGAETDLVDAAAGMRAKLAEQAAEFDAPTFVYMISLLEELRRNVKYSGAARALADAAVVRLAMSRQFSGIDEVLEQLAGKGNTPAGGSVGESGAKKKDDESGVTSDRLDRPPGAAAVAGPARTANGGWPPAAPPVTSRELQRAAGDPFVERVKRAVDGTLLTVRPAARRRVDRDNGNATEPIDDANGRGEHESDD